MNKFHEKKKKKKKKIILQEKYERKKTKIKIIDLSCFYLYEN